MTTNESTAPSPLIHILCLHDGNSSASELYERLHQVDRRLHQNHRVQLAYINSPLLGNDDGHVWWSESQNDDDQKFVGLDATMLYVKQVLASMPFSGVLAVGQGAAIASVLPFLGGQDLEFAIFVHGQSLLEEDESLIEDWPVLHVMDTDSESSQRLVNQFGGQVHESTSPLDTSALNAIGKFVVQQKKQIVSKCSEELVLQNQLFAVEQEAAQLVAQHAMEHPPASLMAAIVPASAKQSVVGAWSGRKPYKQGGGAPCPSEFLLPKEERGDEL